MKLSRRLKKDRGFFLQFLSGEGIEIGALHRPVSAPHLSVKYVDRYSTAELLMIYPELKENKLVEPDILDDAETLEKLPDNSVDFVIANHVIEHMKNPIKALLSWSRVLRPQGKLFLAVPDKRFTFDHKRQLTPVEHLWADFKDPSPERDREAFQDFARRVSMEIFKSCKKEDLPQFTKNLIESDYSIHFHVWTHKTFGHFLKSLQTNLPQWTLTPTTTQSTRHDEFFYVLEKP